jgi:hypothetical protein
VDRFWQTEKYRAVARDRRFGLLLDADERVPPARAAEIRKAMEDSEAAGFEMPRLSFFVADGCGLPAGIQDYVLRLFRRERGRFSNHLVHERVICDGKVKRLATPLTHFAVRRIEDSNAKMDSYSTAGAAEIVATGKPLKYSSGITHGIWAFIRCYFLRLGFLDGREGFLLAVLNAEGTYYRYMKAWLTGRSRELT